MDSSQPVGTVDTLWRFPVKSMLGEQVDVVELGKGGIIGDRAYAVRDRETGKVASAKNPKLWPDLLACRAAFVEPPRPDDELPPVRIDLPKRYSVLSDAPDVDAVLSRFFGRDVELARAAPNDFTIDQYHPDEENYDPERTPRRGRRSAAGCGVLQRARAALRRPGGVVLRPLPAQRPHVIEPRAAERARAAEPLRRAPVPDERDRRHRRARVRRESVARTPARDRRQRADQCGHARSSLRDAELGPGGPSRDSGILKALAKHNRIDVAGSLYPCAGIYAVVESTGTIRTDDRVYLI